MPPCVLVIWDVAGRQVRSLERIVLGGNPLVWDGRDEEGRPVAAGLYLVRPWGSGQTLKIVRVR